MEERDFDVLPLEDEEGTITGYVERESLGNRHCADYKRSFFPSEVVTDSTPLEALFKILWDSPRVFVLENNSITGIITRERYQPEQQDAHGSLLQIRLEIQVLHLIRDYYPDDSWQGSLSPGRLKMAKDLYTRRLARNEEIDLADCLQLCDKRTLLLKDDRLRESLSLGSNSQAERFLKGIEKLRDRLAHGQDIIAGSSWPAVFSLMQQTEKVLEQRER